MRGEYRITDDVDERFRQPSEIPKIIKSIPGFEESVRQCNFRLTIEISYCYLLLYLTIEILASNFFAFIGFNLF